MVMLRLALALLLAQPVFAQDKPAVPDASETARLVWSTLIAVDQGNRTGNYTVLRDLGSPGFRAANDAAKLAAIFSISREQGLPLGLSILQAPVYVTPPAVLEDGRFHVQGSFPLRPTGISFEMLFDPTDAGWQLFGISISPLDVP